jgi:hypothetical protein
MMRVQVVHGFAQTHYSCFLDVMTTIIRTTQLSLPSLHPAFFLLIPCSPSRIPLVAEIFGSTKEFADTLGNILQTIGQTAFAFLQKGTSFLCP